MFLGMDYRLDGTLHRPKWANRGLATAASRMDFFLDTRDREPRAMRTNVSWSNSSLSQRRLQTLRQPARRRRHAVWAQSAAQAQSEALHPLFQPGALSGLQGSPAGCPAGPSHCPSEPVSYASPFGGPPIIFP